MEMCLNLNNAKDPMPTQRMLDAARFTEDILCVDLPNGWNSSFFICSNFLDKYLNNAKEQYAEEMEIFDVYHEFNYHDYVDGKPKRTQSSSYVQNLEQQVSALRDSLGEQRMYNYMNSRGWE